MEFVRFVKRSRGRPRDGEKATNPTLALLQDAAATGGRVAVDIVYIDEEWHLFAQCITAGIESMVPIATSHKEGAITGAQLWKIVEKIMSKVPSASVRIVADRRIWTLTETDRRREVICHAVESSTAAAIAYAVELLEISGKTAIDRNCTLINVLDYCADNIEDGLLENILGALSIPNGIVK